MAVSKPNKKRRKSGGSRKRQTSASPVESASTDAATGDGQLLPFGPEDRRRFLAGITEQCGWEEWAAALAAQKQPVTLRNLLGQSKSSETSLKWSLSEETEAITEQLVSWLAVLRRKQHKDETPGDWSLVISDWLDQYETRTADLSLAVEFIALAHALPRLAVRITGELWTQLFAQLLNGTIEAIESFAPKTPSEFLVSQIAAGEMPITLSYVFPQLEICQDLAHFGREVTAAGLLEVLDGEGTPHHKYVTRWLDLLATWTRTLALDRASQSERVASDARLQFEWFVRQTLRWQRADFSLMLGPSDGAGFASPIIDSAIHVGGDDLDREVRKITKGRLKPAASEYDLPQPGEHSEWSQLAVLRTGWGPRESRLAVCYGRPDLPSELRVNDGQIWNGNTRPEIKVDGRRLVACDEWEELCWSSDDDMDYIELEAKLSHDWTLQRQILVARADRFALISDAVLGRRGGNIDYQLHLPLDADIQCTPDNEHTEVTYSLDRVVGVAMPIGLSEWQSDPGAGRFDGRRIEYRNRGTALYAPLFLDFDRRRFNKPRTWRQLTIAQSLQIVPHDIAVAYRIQVGKKQWIVYRSLGPTANRTFIGQNLISEFTVARFGKQGDLEKLIEIE